jgi:hypothetical protein
MKLIVRFPIVSHYFLPRSPKIGALFSILLRRRSCADVRERVSHPYETTDTLIVVFFLFFNVYRQQTGRQDFF